VTPNRTDQAPPAPSGGVTDVPRLADGVEVLGELSGSGYQDAPTLVRRSDGQTLQVTPLLAQLVDVVDGHRDHAELAEELSNRIGKEATASDVGFLLEKKLAPLGLLHDPDGSAPEVAKANPLLALRFKVVASNPEVTRRITAPFAWLFRSAIVVPVLVAFAVVCWWVLAHHGLASATRSAFYNPPLLLAVLAITVVSAGLHEFGHAAACRYGGATPGAMGAGLYIVWPAFYTNVDDSYRLSRWGRLRVDLGGLYFNALIAVAISTAWWITKEDALLLGVATQLLQMLRQLAPYIRADGYHILADLTGVPDLFSHMKPTLGGLLPWRWGRSTGTPLKRWARFVVIAWVLLVVPMLIAMFAAGVLLLPRLVATAWDSGGAQWSALRQASGEGAFAEVLARFISIITLLLPVAAITFLLTRMLRTAPVRAWRRTEGRPVARTGLATAVVLVMAALAWAWWPAGQYQPVQASETGTIQAFFSEPESVRAPAVTPAIPGVTPQSALALVPRSSGHPVLLLTQGDDGGLRSIVTDGDGDSPTAGQAFPFTLPDAPGEGDNQALAVNTGDGTVEYDVAVAMVWVTDGDPALNTNEAYALASCTGCTTVAVAFQVVLIVDRTDVVAPTNAAVAGNIDCIACSTAAMAVQLVVTLQEMPDDEVRAELDAAMAKLDGLDELTTLDLSDIYDQIKAVEAEVLTILVSHGLVDDVTMREASASASPSSSPSAAGVGSDAPSPEPGSAEPSSSETSTEQSTSPSPDVSASSSSSPSP
jgi:putative peptide zinc metalloprotease protein